MMVCLVPNGVAGAGEKRAETWTEIEFFKQAFFKPASLHDLSLENFESSRG